jgi:predicted dehydrogenase
VAGLGARGQTHIHGILQNPDLFEIVGLYNPGRARRNQVRARFGLDCFYESPEEMMRDARPDHQQYV